jgi:hypothetical protein
MTYRVLTLGDPRRAVIRPIDGWEFHTVPRAVGPPSMAQWAPHRGIANNKLATYIAELRPHFVIVVCEGCVERKIERFGLAPGPKYITWSTDSYRHTIRCTSSDLHLTGIPDAAIRPDDHFVPLFAGPYPFVPLTQRHTRCGIVCHAYDLDDSRRERELATLRDIVPDLVRMGGLPVEEYDARIVDFRYGLNLAIYPDSLPNFRSFELGRAGVMPICTALQRPLLRQLFAEHVRCFDRFDELPALLDEPYDAAALKAFYDEHHSYEARVRRIFAGFFDLHL